MGIKEVIIEMCSERTYATLTAAWIEPGRTGLPSEDGDATTDRVAVVRLCKKVMRRELTIRNQKDVPCFVTDLPAR